MLSTLNNSLFLSALQLKGSLSAFPYLVALSLIQILSIISSSLLIVMLRLRLFRFCSVQPSPILLERYSYKGNKVTGFRALHTVLYQNVIVMRHGERIDNFDPLWASMAAKPWDPPLTHPGRIRAFQTGRKIRQTLGFPIHRVFVSPFLRCIQTAAQLVAALSAVNDGPGAVTGDDVSIDPSKVKVSIEYGLCEMINNIAIRPNVAPKDGNLCFDISELEATLPAGTVDNNVEMVYKELPQWEEPVLQARARYQQTIKDLADKYPTENLLFVTHGEGIQVALSSFKNDVVVNEVQYCGYVKLRRHIFKKDHSSTGGEFGVHIQSGQTGVIYISSQGL